MNPYIIILTIILIYITALLLNNKLNNILNNKDSFIVCGPDKILIDESCYDCPRYSAYNKELNNCIKCDAGYYMSDRVCKKCPTGTVSIIGSEKCDQCTPGTRTSLDNTSCVLCPAGTYSTIGSNDCIPCSVGTYSSDRGSTECKICPIGSIIKNNSCEPCPINTYIIPGTNTCIPCPNNTFSQIGSTSCTPIPTCDNNEILVDYKCNRCPHNFVSNDDHTQCVCPIGQAPNYNNTYCITSCPPGQFNEPYYYGNNCELCNAGSASNIYGANYCPSCPPGSYAPIAGATGCILCPKGQFTQYGSSDHCDNCGYGFFNDKEGQSICQSCPSGTTTLIENAQSITDCVTGNPPWLSCPAGYAWRFFDETCIPCGGTYYTPGPGYTQCLQCPDGQLSVSPATGCYTNPYI